MTPFLSLKQTAKSSLKENWGRAIVALLLTAGISAMLAVTHQVAFHLVPTSASPALLAVFALLELLLVVPVYLGVLFWFWSLTGGGSPALSGMFLFFDSFGRYSKIIWYYINMSLRSLGWAVVFYTGPVSALVTAVWFVRQREQPPATLTAMLATSGLILSAVLLILVTLLYIIHMNRYALAHLLLFEDENRGSGQAIKLSVQYMKGYRLSYLLFGLRFLGWMLLTVLTLGLAYLYTGPYIQASYAAYGRHIIERNRYVPPDVTKEFTFKAD